MKGMERNKRTFWYALFDKKVTVSDEDGYRQYDKDVYHNPVQCQGNIAYELGQTYTEMMTGVSDKYYMNLAPMPLDCPIDEHTILWLDTEPVLNADGSTNTPHDYIVIRKSKSLNAIRYRVRSVNVG